MVGSAAAVAFILMATAAVIVVKRSIHTSPTSHTQATAGWVHDADPNGFEISYPDDWSKSTDAKSGVIRVSGMNGESVAVQPFFTAKALDNASAESTLNSIGENLFPGATWKAADTSRSQVVTRIGTRANDPVFSTLTWTSSDKGTAGYVYFATAPADIYQSSQATFAQIMSSVALKGSPVSAPPAPTYQKWTDPNEAAFALEIPTGATAAGGAVRPSSVLVQSSVTVNDPRTNAELFMGDTFPVYVEPNATLAYGGIGEGDMYSDTSGYNSPVEYYAPGAEYFTKYVLNERAPGATVSRNQARPDLASSLKTAGINSFDAGEVEYEFIRNGTSYKGGALIVTEKVQMAPGYNGWHVWRMLTVEAPAKNYDAAVVSLQHMASSFVIDPQWAESQAHMTAAQSKIITEMGDSVSDSITSGYWQRSKTMDAISERRADAILDIEHVVNPNDGSEFTVESGSNYYWADPQGNVVGTDTSTKPDVNFEQLFRANAAG